uniref:LigA n=1 Tax=Parastrongyloides trichosuri TaxID=131310 RepID=A0A0N4ZA78_PARTI
MTARGRAAHDRRPHHLGRRRPRREARPRLAPPDAGRVRRPVGGQGQSEDLHRRGARALRGAGPRAAVRAAGPGQDDAGADRGARTG